MTCDEFRQLVTGTDALDTTRGTRASALRHMRQCSSCNDWMRLQARRAEVELAAEMGMTAEQIRQCLWPEANAIIAADSLDQEFIQTVEGQ